ncbi:uncharacterized protein LOC143462001 isoform X2 [Clavelina lepadiformis]|uniref:uncharacterized protein LOC143462001 isoform X2 n=1 Tax=Clavelina lepadiformis TaxID=159417 RepID=UPI004042FE40
MKEFALTLLTFVLIGYLPHSKACFPNTICNKQRDTITQLDANIVTIERLSNRGRAWYINPTPEPSNTILAFKNFSCTEENPVMIISYKSTTEKNIQYFYGELGNFELVMENVIGVVLYVPIESGKAADFILNYYSGCQILTSTHSQINFRENYPKEYSKNSQPTCWFIKVNDDFDRSRFYFSLRNVALNDGQQLAIWDLHTSQVVTTVTDVEDYQLVAAQTKESQSILIDLLCTTEDYKCSRKGNTFLISYYGMTTADIACIEIQRMCSSRQFLPDTLCNTTCSAFDNMLIDEYTLESQTQTRSGGAQSDEGLDVIEEEIVLEETPKVEDKTRRRRCPMPPRLCSCPKNTNLYQFCPKHVRCIGQGRCTFACMFSKVTHCLKVRLLNVVKLF